MPNRAYISAPSNRSNTPPEVPIDVQNSQPFQQSAETYPNNLTYIRGNHHSRVTSSQQHAAAVGPGIHLWKQSQSQLPLGSFFTCTDDSTCDWGPGAHTSETPQVGDTSCCSMDTLKHGKPENSRTQWRFLNGKIMERNLGIFQQAPDDKVHFDPGQDGPNHQDHLILWERYPEVLYLYLYI